MSDGDTDQGECVCLGHLVIRFVSLCLKSLSFLFSNTTIRQGNMLPAHGEPYCRGDARIIGSRIVACRNGQEVLLQ